MDKKKKIIFGIVLFLLCALLMFAFANPSEKVAPKEEPAKEETKLKEPVKEETKTDNEQKVVPVVIDLSGDRLLAKQELERYARELNLDTDYESDKNTIVTNGNGNIDNANSKQDITKALDDAKKLLDELKALQDLNKAKESAKKELQDYADEFTFDDEDKEDSILEDGFTNIDNSKDVEEINKSLESAKEELDKLYNEELESLKNKLVSDLENYNNDVVYTDNTKNEISDIKAEANTIITESTTKESAQEYFDSAIESIDKFVVFTVKFEDNSGLLSTIKAEEGVLFANLTVPAIKTTTYTTNKGSVEYGNAAWYLPTSVTKDETIKANYEMTHIYATVYTLTEGVEIPSNKSMYTGSASDYHKYGKKVELKLTDELKSVATKNKTVIITKENIESLVIDSNTLPTNTGTTTEGYYVWYVAKFETSDGFHIDGAVDSANYEVSLTSFEDNKKINNQEGYWFEMYVKDLNDANKVIDSSKIKDVNVYAYDENDNEIVHVFATDTLKESLAGKDFMPNKALSGFANIADQDEYWNHEFTDIEGYVTAKKALVKMTLITGKEIESIIDINVTRFVKFDTTAPVITLDSDVKTTVELGSVFTVPSAKAKDAYDGNVTVESSCNVNADKVGTYNLTYTATDKAGNVATLSFEVKVVDTTSPVITLKGDAKVELNRHLYKENLYTDAGFIVTELDGYTTTKTITFTKPYEETSKVVDKVNTTEVGTYVITYTATDKSNNVGTSQRTIIIDQILNSEADMIVTPYINGEEYDFFTKSYSIEVNSAMPTFTADVKDGFNNKIFNWTDEDTSKYLTISSNVNTSVVGSYTVTYVASDWAGNKKTITRTVNVVDTTSPVITLSNSMEKVSYKGVSFEIPEVVVTDNYDKNLTANTEYSIDKTKYVSSKEEIRGKYFGVIIGYKWNYNEKNEIVSVTYTAKDSNGNEAEPVTYVFPERILISDNYVYTIVI